MQQSTEHCAEHDYTSEPGHRLSQASILVVDDEPGIRNFLIKTLAPRCKYVCEASDSKEASHALDNNQFDIIILDNIMPGKNGVDWLNEQRNIGCFADAILITAYADLETAIRALQGGAIDFVLKPFKLSQILNVVTRCLNQRYLQHENFLLRYELHRKINQPRDYNRLIGQSASICQIRDTLIRIAQLPTSVLISGESGTGKEVAARTLHALSDRVDKPFVPINCAAIPAEMIESELFGHNKGAFTSAVDRREGLLLHASGGCVFLDEISELPITMQSKLLRVLEDKKVRPLGSEREIPIDVRFIFATNANLPLSVQKGLFRTDLFYRINVIHIELPPLRDRKEDIEELAELFMQKMSRKLGIPPLPLDATIRTKLTNMDWPGNIRELQNTIERALILGTFPPEVIGNSTQHTNKARNETSNNETQTLQYIEKQHILNVLKAVEGNRNEASRRLGISRKTIDRKCVIWDI